MTTPVLSLTQTQVLTAVRSFLLGVVPPGTEVIRGQDNRVPEPAADDFIVMTPILQPRLGTNRTTYFDDVFTGSIAGTVLTVSEVDRLQLGLASGMLLIDGVWPTMNVAANTVLGAQLTGTSGGVGTYAVVPSQTVATETMFAGTREDLVAVQFVVQCDVHGPRSADTTRVVESLFRSEYAAEALAASGYDIAPLYASDPRQVPFLNDSDQIEFRWSVDLNLAINPRIMTSQQFATDVDVEVIEAAPEYTGPIV